MNYEKYYIIRLAKKDDIDSIMSFIDTYWRKGHILSYDRELFCYEHVWSDSVNFLLAIRRDSDEIEGILGYYPASKDPEKLDVWTGIWKVREGAVPLLGIELYKRLQKITDARCVLGVGDNPNTTGRLLKAFMKDFHTWRMDHYYLLSDVDDFKIAKISNRPQRQYVNENGTQISELVNAEYVNDFFDFDRVKSFPHKDILYFKHRYFEHPVYCYHVYGLELNDNKALLVTRIQDCPEGNVIRIVDYMGDQICISQMGIIFGEMLKRYKAEYIDFYVHGFEKKYIEEAGFSERRIDDDNIIPNYFSPFVRENIEIYVSGNVLNVLFCKADGDQDRPN